MYTLIAEYDDFIVINKHCDVSIHNESGDGLIEQLRRDRHSRNIFPVHRLDKATSGLLLCALNSQAASELSQLFQNREVEKYYLAISDKKPKKKQGLIKGDMEKARNGSWKLAATKKNPAITQFFSVGLGEQGQLRRLFLLKPYTGKSHQLRVALKSIASPILGDKRYGAASTTSERLYLHAYCLRFSYQGTPYVFHCFPIGGEFTAAIVDYVKENFNAPWDFSWPAISLKTAASGTATMGAGAPDNVEQHQQPSTGLK